MPDEVKFWSMVKRRAHFRTIELMQEFLAVESPISIYFKWIPEQ